MGQRTRTLYKAERAVLKSMSVLVHEEMPERDSEERPEFAALWPRATRKAIRQQMRDKILRQQGNIG